MTPLPNSKITQTIDGNGYPLVTLPSSSNFLRYPIAAFLVFWMGGWLMGELSVIRELITGRAGAADLFLIFWLGGWTVGGFFAMATLWRILRPAVPESLTFSKPQLIYDSGIQPFDMMSFSRSRLSNQMNPWKKIFQKRRVLTFSPGEVGTLKLRDTDGGNRLTIDKENERIDLGEGLTEVEREWLYGQMKSVYNL
jgi:hypothetical protein